MLVKILRKVEDTDSSLVSLSDLVFLFSRKSLALLVYTFLDIELPVSNVNSRLAQIDNGTDFFSELWPPRLSWRILKKPLTNKDKIGDSMFNIDLIHPSLAPLEVE